MRLKIFISDKFLYTEVAVHFFCAYIYGFTVDVISFKSFFIRLYIKVEKMFNTTRLISGALGPIYCTSSVLLSVLFSPPY